MVIRLTVGANDQSVSRGRLDDANPDANPMRLPYYRMPSAEAD
jgi:hypothetical protein